MLISLGDRRNVTNKLTTDFGKHKPTSRCQTIFRKNLKKVASEKGCRGFLIEPNITKHYPLTAIDNSFLVKLMENIEIFWTFLLYFTLWKLTILSLKMLIFPHFSWKIPHFRWKIAYFAPFSGKIRGKYTKMAHFWWIFVMFCLYFTYQNHANFVQKLDKIRENDEYFDAKH